MSALDDYLIGRVQKSWVLRDEAIDEVTALRETIDQAREALAPFAHCDLTKILSGNTEGDNSIIFQRNDAVLTIAHFKRAAAWLAAHPAPEQKERAA